MNHGEIIRLLTKGLLEKSKRYLLLCEGIDDGLFGTISGLSARYPDQCIELPCSENASVGMALGSACYGMLPILCFQRVEFALLAIEQLVNNSSKINYLSCGSRKNPSLFRFIIGRGWGQGPSHSQSLEGLFIQIPEVDLFLPAFPEDSEFIFNFFSSRPAPTISLEHRWIHYAKSSSIKVKKPAPYVVRTGIDITIVASSYNVLMAMRVAKCAQEIGIEVEVINLFCLSNKEDCNVILSSVQKTGNIIFLDLSHSWNGISNHYISRICQMGHRFASAPIVIGCKQAFSPSSFRLVEDYYVNCVDIGSALSESLGLESEKRTMLIEQCVIMDKASPPDQPSLSFTGPF